MARYVLIESTERGESFTLARDLTAAGNDVTCFLVQNAVYAARRNDPESKLRMLRGVDVRVDDASLRQRRISTDELHGEIRVAPLEDLEVLLAQPEVHALWR
jgi:predicted peroxiredoxin